MNSKYGRGYYHGSSSPYKDYGKGLRFIITSHLWVLIITLVFRPKKVLDVGCATGEFVKIFRKYGVEAYGLDLSQYAIEHAKVFVRQYLRNSDASNMPFDNEVFDLVYSFDVLEHIPENKVAGVLAECNRVGRKWVIHKINTGIMEFVHPDQTHITLRSMIWWQAKIETSLGSKVYPLSIPMSWIMIGRNNN